MSTRSGRTVSRPSGPGGSASPAESRARAARGRLRQALRLRPRIRRGDSIRGGDAEQPAQGTRDGGGGGRGLGNRRAREHRARAYGRAGPAPVESVRAHVAVVATSSRAPEAQEGRPDPRGVDEREERPERAEDPGREQDASPRVGNSAGHWTSPSERSRAAPRRRPRWGGRSRRRTGEAADLWRELPGGDARGTATTRSPRRRPGSEPTPTQSGAWRAERAELRGPRRGSRSGQLGAVGLVPPREEPRGDPRQREPEVVGEVVDARDGHLDPAEQHAEKREARRRYEPTLAWTAGKEVARSAPEGQKRQDARGGAQDPRRAHLPPPGTVLGGTRAQARRHAGRHRQALRAQVEQVACGARREILGGETLPGEGAVRSSAAGSRSRDGVLRPVAPDRVRDEVVLPPEGIRPLHVVQGRDVARGESRDPHQSGGGFDRRRRLLHAPVASRSPPAPAGASRSPPSPRSGVGCRRGTGWEKPGRTTDRRRGVAPPAPDSARPSASQAKTSARDRRQRSTVHGDSGGPPSSSVTSTSSRRPGSGSDQWPTWKPNARGMPMRAPRP